MKLTAILSEQCLSIVICVHLSLIFIDCCNFIFLKVGGKLRFLKVGEFQMVQFGIGCSSRIDIDDKSRVDIDYMNFSGCSRISTI